jgi:hypothetical protein
MRNEAQAEPRPGGDTDEESWDVQFDREAEVVGTEPRLPDRPIGMDDTH